MVICEVVGNIWATRKDESLKGAKLMMVKQVDYFNETNYDTFVAADMIGAGVGEKVLVVNGSTARRALGSDAISVDAAIVGIIDSMEVDKEYAGRK